MNLFIVFATGLVVLALVLLLPPLLRRTGSAGALDRDAYNVAIARDRLGELKAEHEAGRLSLSEFDHAQAELERSLAADLAGDSADAREPGGAAADSGGMAVAALVAAAIAIGSAGLYLHLGAPGGIGVSGPGEPVPAIADAGRTRPLGPDGKPLPPVEEMVENLARKMEAEPDNADGWTLLGRSYAMLNRWTEAAEAWRRAHELVPEEPDVLLGYAESLGMAQGGELTGNPEALIDQALASNPEHPKGLWFGGLAAYERQDWNKAARRFRALWPMVRTESETADRLKDMIVEVERKGGIQGEPLESAGVPTVAAAGIEVEVRLDPELKAQVGPEDAVFVFARALQGPPMPLAAVRAQVKDLPLRVHLDDESAMMPQMKLSNFEQVLVGARISKAGTAIAQSGDLFGEVSPVRAGERVVVTMDRRKP